ncbi:MAG: ABC transporter ATP-binding protein [Candidatus Pacebacteria bacterium]|nr:ABC transporter ATP-binding protein [Candidatus Paceibacterota bacterium]
MRKTQIKLENVYKTYQMAEIKIEVLKGINLEVFEKDFLILLGPSGSGKSTLLHIMSCLDLASKGNIFLNNKNVINISEDALAEIRGKKIGFIFQNFNLISHLTALENVALPAIFQSTNKEQREKKARLLLQEVGLEHRLNHKPAKLSGGEKQRVAIARSLINDPEIIVADEPTGDVDSKTGQMIMEIFKKLNQSGKTIIVVTHDLDLINYGNRVIKIKDGILENV